MKAILSHTSRRWGYDGWALRVRGAKAPLGWSMCTTRREARDLRRERDPLFRDLEVVKVRAVLEVVGS